MIDFMKLSYRRRGVAWGVLAFVLVWTWARAIGDGNLDGYGDMLENFAWAQGWSWGTHKHPPVIAWVVRLWFGVWPVSDVAYKLLAYVNVGVGLLGMLALARLFGLGGMAWAVLAVASWGFPNTSLAAKLNADTILLSLWPWVAVAWVQVFERRARWPWAVALGVLSALAVLAKYYSGLLLVGLFASSLLSSRGRRWYGTLKPWGVLAVFVLAVAPHVLWEHQHGWITFKYVQDHGVPQVVWSDFWKFAVSPALYWPLAWLGAALLISPAGERWRGLGRRLLQCWKAPSWHDPLLWMVLMPWLLTVGFGLSSFVKLTIHWAIPLGFVYPVFWVRNLSLAYPDAAPVANKAAQRAFAVVLALVAVAGPVNGWVQANATHENNYYLPRQIAASTLQQSWQQRYPNVPLRWVGGQWQENGMMPFYDRQDLWTVPGTPDSLAAQAMPLKDWAAQGGGLLCPGGWVSKHRAPNATELQEMAATLQTSCALNARTWLAKMGQTQAPIAVVVERKGWAFPKPHPYAYVMFVYLPK